MPTTTPFALADLEAAAAVVRAVVPATPQYAWPLLASRSGAEVYPDQGCVSDRLDP